MTALEGSVVVVTGGGRGIGRSIAEELARGGANIVVNYAHSKGPAEEVAQWLREHGSPQALAIGADVTDATQAASLIEETVRRLGRIDVLVNNAGITLDRTMKKMAIEDWDTVILDRLEQLFLHHQSRTSVFHRAEERRYHQHQFLCRANGQLRAGQLLCG